MEPGKELSELIERELGVLGYEVIKTEALFSGRRKALRIFIDRPEAPVTIHDCVRVTKALGLVLDASETVPGPYNLEISSPGLARPLTKPAHFARFRGERSRVEYLDDAGVKTTAIGAIVDASETAVTISVDGVDRVIPHARIVKANLHPADQGLQEPEGCRQPRRGRRDGKRF
ncbi:MAG: ribosome maturation factor RimP [Candidatus Krumholzibacteria bacterium]|nr:ribosome maturation factor RimP [Candidatus Krumholzibacteria bacterium]